MKIEIKKDEMFLYAITMKGSEMRKFYNGEKHEVEFMDNDYLRDNATESELKNILDKAEELSRAILDSVARRVLDMEQEMNTSESNKKIK